MDGYYVEFWTLVKALVGAFNQEKALVRAFSVIVKTGCGTDGSFYSTNREAVKLFALEHSKSFIETFGSGY